MRLQGKHWQKGSKARGRAEGRGIEATGQAEVGYLCVMFLYH